MDCSRPLGIDGRVMAQYVDIKNAKKSSAIFYVQIGKVLIFYPSSYFLMFGVLKISTYLFLVRSYHMLLTVCPLDVPPIQIKLAHMLIILPNPFLYFVTPLNFFMWVIGTD